MTERGPYAKTPEVRGRIVAAATELFAVQGYRGATMKAIAAAAGLTPKGLNHHFATKDELLMEVLSDRDRRGYEPAPERGPFEVILEITRQNRSAPRLVELHTVLSAEAIASDHPAHDAYRERYEVVRNEVALAFGQLLDRDPEQGATADDLAVLLIAVMDGLQIQWLYDESAVDMESLVRIFVNQFVPGATENTGPLSAATR